MQIQIQNITKKIIPTLKSQGIVKAGIFGSYATGEAKENSDVDLLVELKDDKSLLDLVGLKLELEDVLGRKVDVLTYDAIYPPLRDIILNEQKLIYEKRSINSA